MVILPQPTSKRIPKMPSQISRKASPEKSNLILEKQVLIVSIFELHVSFKI